MQCSVHKNVTVSRVGMGQREYTEIKGVKKFHYKRVGLPGIYEDVWVDIGLNSSASKSRASPTELQCTRPGIYDQSNVGKNKKKGRHMLCGVLNIPPDRQCKFVDCVADSAHAIKKGCQTTAGHLNLGFQQQLSQMGYNTPERLVAIAAGSAIEL